MRQDGTLLAFEVTSAWISFHAMFKILRSVEGVTNVQRRWFSEDHATFSYFGEQCVVWEPWGDNDRYWIGPKEAGNSKLDITPMHMAFQNYKNPLARLWSAFRDQ